MRAQLSPAARISSLTAFTYVPELAAPCTMPRKEGGMADGSREGGEGGRKVRRLGERERGEGGGRGRGEGGGRGRGKGEGRGRGKGEGRGRGKGEVWRGKKRIIK